jgi:hypothetical protein
MAASPPTSSGSAAELLYLFVDKNKSSKDFPYYLEKIDNKLTSETRHLLETYSKILQSDVLQHVRDILSFTIISTSTLGLLPYLSAIKHGQFDPIHLLVLPGGLTHDYTLRDMYPSLSTLPLYTKLHRHTQPSSKASVQCHFHRRWMLHRPGFPLARCRRRSI